MRLSYRSMCHMVATWAVSWLVITIKKRNKTNSKSATRYELARHCRLMRVDEERKGWSLVAIKMKARTVVGKG